MAEKQIAWLGLALICGFGIGVLIGFGFVLIYIEDYIDNCQEMVELCIERYNDCRFKLQPLPLSEVTLNATILP